MLRCRRCQFEYEPVAPDGPCPRCALAAALAAAEGDAAGDDYEFVAELGRGGMGRVTLVRQRSLDRLVALKVIAAGPDDAGTGNARLLREARSAAAIAHPHVVAIHEVGQGASGAYIAMEYCEGGSLRDRLRAGPLAPRAAAELARKLADAVANAHGAGVLHRDLKPSNVLLTAAGEPKLADFGLSGSAAGSTGEVTRTGEIAGSPSYLAPELLAAGGAPSPAVDIYGLGAVLYECVCARAPFTGENVAAVLAQIPATDAPAPRLLNPAVPRDLETIILKCLEKRPTARYASAAALRDDLSRFLGGQPIAARPLSAPERAWRWGRRNPGPAIAAIAVVTLLAVVAAGSSLAAWRLEQEQARTAAERDRAEEAGRETREALSNALVAQARALRMSGRQGQRFETLRLVREAMRIAERRHADETNANAKSEAVAALALDDWRWEKELPSFPQLGSFTRLDFRPDLSTFGVLDANGTGIEIRRTADNSLVRALPAAFESKVSIISFGPAEGWVGAYYVGERQAVWGPGDVKPRWTHSPPEVTYGAMAFAPGRTGWWFTGAGHQLHWHDAATNAEHAIGGRGTRLYGISPSPDGSRLALVRDDRIEVWDVRADRLVWQWEGDVGFAPAAWSPDGRWILSDRFIGSPELVVWDAATGTASQVLRASPLRAVFLGFHPDGRRLVATDGDSVTRILDRWTGAELVRGKTGQHVLRIAADGSRVAVGNGIRRFGVVELAAHTAIRPMPLLGPKVGTWRHAEASPDGRWLLASTNQSVHLWSVASGAEVLRHDFKRDERAHAVFHPRDGSILFSGLDNGHWRLEIEAPTGSAMPHWRKIEKLAAPPRTLVRAIVGGGAWWWVEDYANEQGFAWPEGDPSRAVALAGRKDYALNMPSASGRWFAPSRRKDGTGAAVGRWPENELLQTLTVEAPAWGVFSPDDRWLVLASKQGYAFWGDEGFKTSAGTVDANLPASPYGHALFRPGAATVALGTLPHTIDLCREPEDWPANRRTSWKRTARLTLPRETEIDAWTWTKDGKCLAVLSGAQAGLMFDLPRVEEELEALGRN